MGSSEPVVRFDGLGEAEAARRLREEGFNELPSAKKHSALHTVLAVLSEPMLLLLLGCAVIYLVLADIQEALILLGSALLIIGITFVQERRTERALEALRDLSSPRALVIRDGIRKRIAGRDVVRGDVVVLAEGDRVPADAGVLECASLQVDESLLTGESVAVSKAEWDRSTALLRPGGENHPFVYSGTLVTKGRAIVEVLATGERTEIGKIGTHLKAIEQESTKLQGEIRRIVRVMAVSGLVLCLAVTVVFALSRGNWLGGLLSGLSLAMAMVPEEFPVVLTIFLALGAWRMTQKRVLTRRMPVLETLGATTVLCVDKTGTLTENRMVVRELRLASNERYIVGEPASHLGGDLRMLAECAILASPRDPFDPMEIAIHSLGGEHFEKESYPGAEWTLEKEYPLDPSLLAVTNIWKTDVAGDGRVVAVKGALEAVAELCGTQGAALERLHAIAAEMASEGLRVLAVARGSHSAEAPESPRMLSFDFVGFVGLYDPPKASAAAALAECYSAGVRVVMITGDYPATATAIGKQIGMHDPEAVITGAQLETMGDDELSSRIASTSVFARVMPEQKLKIVRALKARGEVVAMTGDGVNDAPALRAANVGIAMGGRGTDVAREASSLVLLDDDFASIVEAIRNGRRIFDNLKKAIAYIFAIHVPTAGMTLLPLLFGMPVGLFPVHIIFLELIIDPACTIAFEAEPEEDDVMKRKPRPPKAQLFSRRMISLSLLQGAVSVILVFGIYAYVLSQGRGELEARSLAFATVVFSNLCLILTNRSWSAPISKLFKRKNKALAGVIGGTLVLLALVLYVPFLQRLFHFHTLHPDDLIFCVGAGFVSILWFELLKVFHRVNPEV